MTSAVEPAVLAGAVDDDCAYFEGDGHVLLGRGTRQSWQVSQEEIRAGWDLAQRELRDSGSVAFVSFPFDRAEPVSVRIPEQVAWAGPDGWRRAPSPELLARRPVPPDGLDVSAWQVRSAISPRQWCADVRTAVHRINSGELTKVVLARRIVVERDTPFAPGAVLAKLRARFPGGYLFSIGGLVGASPELLVGRDAGELFALPLAGTVPRYADPAADRAARSMLVASAKLAHEHDVTRQEVIDVFDEVCSTVKVGDQPIVISTSAVHHLASAVSGIPRPDAPDLLAVAARMHPTAAVCGHPRQSAYELIRGLEPEGRGGYAGAVGWLDADGNGRFAVAIRCVELDGSRAVIRVGNGIVGASDPEDELAETRAKLNGLLESVVVP
jgi:menaquinone-specific isochorismate synthase